MPSLAVYVCRPARAMNRMDESMRLTHARLEEWANQVRHALSVLGYSSESHYHKWALLGIAPNPGHEPLLSDRCAHVDAAVARLPGDDKAVIDRNYLWWRPGDALWQGVTVSRRQFDEILKRARLRIDGYLRAKEG